MNSATLKEPYSRSARVEERHWDRFHDPRNPAMVLASEAGELIAEFRSVPNHQSDEWLREPADRARVAGELAEVAIAYLLCQHTDLDFHQIVRAKLVQNAERYPVERSRGIAAAENRRQ